MDELSIGSGLGTGFYLMFVRHLAGSSGVGDTYIVLGYVRDTGSSNFSVVGTAPAGTSASYAGGVITLSWDSSVWTQAWLFKVS